MAHRSSAAETLSQTTSESSTSLSSSMEITVEKYQRLATEYAKVCWMIRIENSYR